MKKKRFPILIFAIALFSAAAFFGCSAKLSFVRREENYSEFLSHLTIYTDPEKPDTPEDPSEPSIEFDGPSIDGFTPLYFTGFDYASACGGNYVFVKSDGHGLALGKDGEVFELDEDLCDKELISDKYIFSRDGKCGVKDIFGNVVVPAEYVDAEIVGDTVAAHKDNLTDIFAGGVLRSSADENVKLVSEKFLLGARGVYDLDMDPLFCGEYRMILPPVNGVGIIDGDGLFGYGNVMGEVTVEPIYKRVSDFSDGYAAVVTSDDLSAIIDMSGNEILVSADTEARFISYDGKYLLYLSTDGIHVADKYMNDVTDDVFASVAESRVYGDLIITDNGTRVYSLTERKFVSERFASVSYRFGIFVAERESGGFVLCDGGFERIASEIEYACYENGVLTVGYNGKYYLYTAEL